MHPYILRMKIPSYVALSKTVCIKSNLSNKKYKQAETFFVACLLVIEIDADIWNDILLDTGFS